MTGRTIRNANMNLRDLTPRLVEIVLHTEGPCFGITCRKKRNQQNPVNHLNKLKNNSTVISRFRSRVTFDSIQFFIVFVANTSLFFL